MSVDTSQADDDRNALLRECATAIQRSVRAHDIVARPRPSEIAILAASVSNAAARALELRLAGVLADAAVPATVAVVRRADVGALDTACIAARQRIARRAADPLGQVEQPPGSNHSARIAQYRAAVPGGPVGPWCAYFVSWVAQQNGTPLGDNGQGFGRVDDVYAWAQRTGRAVPAGPGAQPKPGDLVIWDEHMGIVESVGPDGSIRTIEGNSSDSVAQRSYGPDGGGAVGYVRMS